MSDLGHWTDAAIDAAWDDETWLEEEYCTDHEVREHHYCSVRRRHFSRFNGINMVK